MRTLLASALLTAALAAPALAQPAKAADVTTMASDDCAKARKAGKTCVLTIEDEDITGTTPTYGDTNTAIVGFGDHDSLIKLRRDFIPEILRTAEDID
ncbi:MAG: hypothetical protein IPQ07_17265 [Myxococcales bacterium]|nr:hypothetical protein [Myxococcales bacterium]